MRPSPSRCVPLLLATVLAAGCSGGGGGGEPSVSPTPTVTVTPTPTPTLTPTPTPVPGFTFAVSPGTLNVPQGGSAALDVTVTREAGFDQTIELTVDGLPAGVSATPLSIAPPETAGKITLTALPTVAVPAPIDVQVSGHAAVGTNVIPLHLTVRGAPATLDRSFGPGAQGFLRTNRPRNILDLARQPDGKLLLTGTSHDDDLLPVCRLQPDGAADPSFGGSDGCARFDVGLPATGRRLEAHGGLIYVIGHAFEWDGPGHGFVARITGAGALDPSFGGSGLVSLPAGFYPDRLRFDDGGLVVAGTKTTTGFSRAASLLRVRLDGSLDAAFGANQAETFGNDCVKVDLTRLGDGRLIVAVRNSAFAFHPDGTADESFGMHGEVWLPALPYGYPTLSVDGAGGLVASGNGMAVARFSTSGEVTDFYPALYLGLDSAGDPRLAHAEDLWVLDDGTMVMAGRMNWSDWRMIAVGRRLPNGAADTSFGSGGAEHWEMEIDSEGHAIEVLPDGRYVVVGTGDESRGLVLRVWN